LDEPMCAKKIDASKRICLESASDSPLVGDKETEGLGPDFDNESVNEYDDNSYKQNLSKMRNMRIW